MSPRVDSDLLVQAIARKQAIEQSFQTSSLGAFIEQTCARLGDAPAINVFDRHERVTYRQLSEQTNRIGNMLRNAGIRKGDRVAVMLPNRIEYPLVWIALAKIGAIHVPVNNRYTPREIAYVASDSGATAAIVDHSFMDTFKNIEPGSTLLVSERIFVIGDDPDTCAWHQACQQASDTSCLDSDITADDLMAIQYTSGTTGFPKGCMLTHEYWMILSLTAWQWDARPCQRLLSAQPFFYMDPPWHMLKTFRHGGELYLAPRLSSTRFTHWVKDHGIQWCQFPELMTRQPAAPDDGRTQLRQVATFGWSPDTCRHFRQRFQVTAREAFGMTEIGLGTWMPAEFDAMYDSGSVGIDAPFRETTLRDEQGQPVPAGEPGELWVRGRSIFKGYWNKPEANADVFRDGWFRTGDIFRCDPQGFLWIVGRIKDMIRRSSENISAREVEAVVREMPWVEDCAAVAVPDPARGEEVKIYIQAKDGTQHSDALFADLLGHCRANLAAFKVPRYFAWIDQFPRTVSNKIEKRILTKGCADLRVDAWDAQQSGQASS